MADMILVQQRTDWLQEALNKYVEAWERASDQVQEVENEISQMWPSYYNGVKAADMRRNADRAVDMAAKRLAEFIVTHLPLLEVHVKGSV